MRIVFLLSALLFSYVQARKPSAASALKKVDPFTINLGKQKTVSIDLKKLLPERNREKVTSVGDFFVGILHENLKCIEFLTEHPVPYLRSDGLYNHVPAQYDITEGQFRTLLDNNPLVIVQFTKVSATNVKRFSDFKICGESMSSFADQSQGESVRVLVRENLQKPTITPKGSPDDRCNNGYIPYSEVPGIDVPYFRDIQTNPLLKRFGLSSLTSVNDLPEGVQFILPQQERPLLGFSSDQSIQSLFFEQPQCTVAYLQQQLQTAIELEWATIPLYLTAYYSIKSDNTDIRQTIDEIFIQEMLHFAQAANLLIAVGGVPVMNASTAPTYPRVGLPGKVLEGLPIPLTKLTKEQTYHTFMGVEVPNNSSAVNPPLINDLFTIGAFYQDVLNCIEFLGDSVFDSPSGDQVQYNFYSSGTLYQVNSVETARSAIDQIVAQGEGETPLNPDQIGSDGYAHFYKFEEIVCGKKLVKKDETYYAYEGESIPFSQEGVYNMIANPTKHTITPGTDCYNAVKAFSDGYTVLIEKLEHAFQVVSSSTINAAVGEMFTLAGLVRDVFEVPYEPGSPYTCGPVWNMDFS